MQDHISDKKGDQNVSYILFGTQEVYDESNFNALK